MTAASEKEPFNLSIKKDVKRAMKVYCAETDQDVSEVTEKLYAELLQREGRKTRRKK